MPVTIVPPLSEAKWLAPLASGGKMDAAIVSVRPFAEAEPPHQTALEAATTAYVLSGEAQLMVEGSQTLLRAGDAVCIQPGVSRAYRNSTSGTCTLLVVLSRAQ